MFRETSVWNENILATKFHALENLKIIQNSIFFRTSLDHLNNSSSIIFWNLLIT